MYVFRFNIRVYPDLFVKRIVMRAVDRQRKSALEDDRGVNDFAPRHPPEA